MPSPVAHRLLAIFGLALLLTYGAVEAARAEELVALISEDTISIDAAYEGARLTLAGEIRPGHGAEATNPVGPYHVVIIVRGPGQDRVVRGAERHLGIWLNTRQALFEDSAGFYWKLASGRLEDIVREDSPSYGQLTAMPPFAAEAEEPSERAALGTELRRLMTEDGFYGVNERGVQFRSNRFYTAALTLPTTAPTGLYLARTYVLKDGIVVARTSQSFSVRVVGFERLLAVAAQTLPLLYGIGCVALALFTGWLGGVVFKR